MSPLSLLKYFSIHELQYWLKYYNTGYNISYNISHSTAQDKEEIALYLNSRIW